MFENLSKLQRDMLIEHACGPMPVLARCQVSDPFYHRTLAALLRHRLVRGEPSACFPKRTTLTDLGKEVACKILGEYAEALLRVAGSEQRLIPKWRPPQWPQNSPTKDAVTATHGSEAAAPTTKTAASVRPDLRKLS